MGAGRVQLTGGRGGRLRAMIALGLAGALAALALSASKPPPAAAAGPGLCPFTFQVLHNDRIGPAVLPKGTYQIRLLRSTTLTCQQASRNFTLFLQDYDGRLPKPWKVVAKGKGNAIFTYSGLATIRVTRLGGGGGSGGGGGAGQNGVPCPGSFHVLHNDRIGPLRFPRGYYKLVIPKGSTVACPQAVNLFRQFLNRPSGNLPNHWKVKPFNALFFKVGSAKTRKFRVDPAT